MDEKRSGKSEAAALWRVSDASQNKALTCFMHSKASHLKPLDEIGGRSCVENGLVEG